MPDILDLVHALAAYEQEPEAVEATEADFARVLFPEQGAPTAFAEVVEAADHVVGVAIWYLTFSTWTGRNGIWLEDLFVRPEHRGAGLGRALLSRLASIALERDYPRLEWWVLDWNAPSIAFYRALGAVPQDEWATFRLDDPALDQLGGGQ